jgi:ribosomal protein S12 methylthiotransferase accessory factor
MSSSLRDSTLEDTLLKARALAPALGITRVTDTTWLDRIGIPVYAGIRPGAAPGSLCVNAGKGLRPAEAEVGAYMEAIEYACAEYGHVSLPTRSLTPAQLTAQPAARFRFLDLCPLLGRAVDPAQPVVCVPSEDIDTGEQVWIPAELVYVPYRANPGQRIFGSSTNGLSSGNSLAEATLHGLAELIERDVHAHHLINDTSVLVATINTPTPVQALIDRIVASDLEVVLRHTANEFGLPFFHSYILEKDPDAAVSVAFGCGLHLYSDIAAVRAIAEAAQSRLTAIHGGRDDLIDRYDFFAGAGRDTETEATAAFRAAICRVEPHCAFGQVADLPPLNSVTEALTRLRAVLRARGFAQTLRVDLSPPDSGIAVVRTIVPGLESFQPALKRAGTRLARGLAARSRVA